MRDTDDDLTTKLLDELGWVRELSRSLVRDSATAEDAVQEACLAVLTTGSRSVEEPRGFLRAIVRNALRERARSEAARRGREQAAATPREVPSPEELALRFERQRLVSDAVLKLDEPFRSTVVLRYLDGLDSAEIARRQRVPAGTVRRRLKTALERLREHLDRSFDGDRRAWAVALLPFLNLDSAWLFQAAAIKTASIGGALAMKKTVLVAGVLVIAAGLVAVAISTRDDPARPSNTNAERALVAADDPLGSSTGDTDLADAAVESARTSPVARAAVNDVVRVAGRVLVPAGCMHDESLEALALDRALDYGTLARLLDDVAFDSHAAQALADGVRARSRVGADGEFELALPKGVSAVHVALRGRTLYLPHTHPVDLAHGDVSDIVLTPSAGAWITGRLEAPRDRAGAVSATPLRLVGARTDLTPSAGILGRGFGIDVRADDAGRFELRALPLDLEYALFVVPEQLAAHKAELSGLTACERKELTLALRSGATVRGRVIDADGRAVAGAEVEALLPGKWLGLDDFRARVVTTDAAGAFELRAVPATSVRLRAWKPGLLDSEKLEIVPVDGGEISGVELALGRGRAISGHVAFFEAGPAAAEISVEFDRAFLANESTFHARRGARGEARADLDGKFVVAGLGEGPFVVRASALAADGSDWRARRDGVRPDEVLDLTLHPSVGLRGVARDAVGVPVPSFEVHAVRIVDGALGPTGLERESERVTDAQGRFFLADLDEGTWEVYAEAPGLVSSRAVRANVPDARGSAPIEIVLLASATITGRVVAHDGGAAAGAEVRVDAGALDADAELTPGRIPPRVRADANGAFRLEGLTAGSVRIVASASAESTLASAPAVLSLAPGEVVDGIVLTLRQSARLTGDVYDERGGLAVGHMVHVESASAGVRFTTVDERGRFELADLAPGAWQVVAIDLNAASKPPPGTAEMDALVGTVRMTRVELAEGESEHVVLGAPPEAPVRVHGTVTQGGKPRGGAWIVFFPSSGGGAERLKIATVDGNGRYETILGAPGSYDVHVQQIPGNEESTIDFTRDVPASTSHRFDIALPAGRISGRVIAPDGSAAVSARVTIASEGSTHAGEYTQGQYTELLTDARGRFEVPGLRGGTYAIGAGGPSARAACFARIVRAGIVLADGASIDDLELRLPDPGSITVRARAADGEPIENAAIFVRDAAGHVVDAISESVTDEHGRGAYACLAPGTYTVQARAGTRASRESAAVRVVAGDEVDVELVLVPGTALKVILRDADGRAQNGWVLVNDEAGREVGGMYPAKDVEAHYFAGGFSSSAPVFGPLPPGRYTVVASAPGCPAKTRSVELSGEPEVQVEIELTP